jgi:hypothetical protein
MKKRQIREMTVNGPALVLWGRGKSFQFLFETYVAGDADAIKRSKQLCVACADIPAGKSMAFPVPVSA